MKKMYVVMAALLLWGASAEAQFFKKLTKKVNDKVEKTITKNVSDKAAKETDDALNKVWEMNNENTSLSMGSSIDPSAVPDSYSFDWKLNYSAETKEGKMDLVYRIKKDANYMGMAMSKMANMFIVLDNENKLSVIYMNGKLMRATKMNTEALDQTIENETPQQDIEYKKIGSKTILGYDCEGYKGENKEYIFIVYITDDAEVSFSDFATRQKYLPDSFNPNWIDEDSLLMEMQMKNKKDTDKSMTMTCTSIEKEDFTIRK